MLLLEGVDLRRLPVAAHRSERCRSLGDRRRRGGRPLPLDPLTNPRIRLLESLDPQRDEVVHRVGADALERPGDLAAHLFVGLEFGIDVLSPGRRGGDNRQARCGEADKPQGPQGRQRLQPCMRGEGGHPTTPGDWPDGLTKARSGDWGSVEGKCEHFVSAPGATESSQFIPEISTGEAPAGPSAPPSCRSLSHAAGRRRKAGWGRSHAGACSQ